MEHFFQKIHGWFTFPRLYSSVVKEFNSAAIFVEIGTWLGQSASYMAVEIANSNKSIEFYCIDTWKGSDEINHQLCDDILNDTLYESFLENIQPVKEYIIPIRVTSLEAVDRFENSSIDFIFIDASHYYEDVKADLNAWYPKIKPTGVFSGHDYDWPEVKQAVDEFCQQQNLGVVSDEKCWVTYSLI